MRVFLSLLLLTVTLCAFTQNYSIGHRQLAWADASRDNRPVKFEVYYPATNTGDNVPVINNGKKFPLIVFGHGYQLTYTDYKWLKDSLVTKGFFLVFPRTEEQLFPSHTDFAKDYAFIINRFHTTKTNSAVWYYNRIKNKYAVGGHSMGGGCSMLSVQYSSNIAAVFNLAAAETNPSAIAACSSIAIPALVFAGKKDCISPPASNQLPMYNKIQNNCKTYVLITEARHCHWSNNGSCRGGEIFCSPRTVPPGETLAITCSLLQPWLDDKLNGNNAAATNFQNILASANGFTYQQNCAANNVVADVADVGINSAAKAIKLYPSRARAGYVINISMPELQSKSRLQIYNQSGKPVYTKIITSSKNRQPEQISTANFQKGIYFILITDEHNQYKNTFVIE